MNCQECRDQLWLLLDRELPAEQAAATNEHLRTCGECAAEFARNRAVATSLDTLAEPIDRPPADLWAAIETQLPGTAAMAARPGRRRRLVHLGRRSLAAAAALLLALGSFSWLLVSLSPAPQQAVAAVDYSLLLQNVDEGPDAAIARFLEHHQAVAIAASQAWAVGRELSFAIPQTLPTGHVFEQAYRLDFAGAPAIAVRYRRDGEPLVAFFHRSALPHKTGLHNSMPCEVNGQHGHHVEAGDWRLVHFADPSTCHCVLSRLDLERELPGVLRSLAPDFDRYSGTTQPAHSQHEDTASGRY